MTNSPKVSPFIVALAGLATGIAHFTDYVGQKRDYAYLPEAWLPPWDDLNDILMEAQRLVAGTNQGYAPKKPEQLQSIFCSLIGLEDEQSREDPPARISPPLEKYLGFNALKIQGEADDNDDTEAIIFPAKTPSGNSAKGLWDEFKVDLDKLKPIYNQAQEKHLPVYVHNLLNLMQRYTWCVPAPDGEGVGDISLYDYSRMVAAVAVCLSQKPATEDHTEEHTKERVAYLVGGDISGVQSFIYTITSQGATAGLRGRSLYLQLLTDVVSRRVLEAFELPFTNLIYGGGGNFYVLIPPGRDTKTTLNNLQGEIDEIFLHHHRGDLYLSLGGKGLTTDQFHGSALSTVWQGVGERLQRKKLQPFNQLENKMADLLFAGFEAGGDRDEECAVCGREHPKTKEFEGVRKCPPCEKFEDVGDDLRGAIYLSLTKIERTPLPEERTSPKAWYKILRHFGYKVQVGELLSRVTEKTAYQEIYTIKTTASPKPKATPTSVVGHKFLVNVTPGLLDNEYKDFKDKIEDLRRDSVKSFGVIASQAQGIKRLGILRMDVDNLGQIFSKGLADNANLARIATLSFSMNLFFEGWVEQLAERVNQDNQAQRGDILYSIYAGGDDLFFVGAWDVMPNFAWQISQDFQRYAAHHPGLHLSGGLALVPSKYPLYQAAEDAHKAESAAKNYRAPQVKDTVTTPVRYTPSEKNAFSFLGQTFPWTRYEDVIAKQTLLDKLVTGKDKNRAEISTPVPKSLLQRLLQLYAEYTHEAKKQAKKGDTLGRNGQSQVYWGPWHWHAAYSLTRLAQQVKRKNKAAGDTIEKDIRDSLQHENFTEIYWWALAARWTDLLMRSGEIDN